MYSRELRHRLVYSIVSPALILCIYVCMYMDICSLAMTETGKSEHLLCAGWRPGRAD